MKPVIAIIAAGLLLGACAQNQGGRFTYTPVVDLKSSGKDSASYRADLDECQQLAAQRNAAGDAAGGAIAGALLGALVGGITGHAMGIPQTGAAYGAAYGAVGGGVQAGASGYQNQRQIVQRCLMARGYTVLGT